MNGQQRVAHLVTLMAIAVPVSFLPPAAATSAAEVRDHRVARHAVVELLDRMPLLFVPEQVSSDGAMGYAVRGKEASVWLGPSGLSYRLHPANGSFTMASSWVVALDLVGATPRQPVGEDLLPTKVSYFKGPKNEWRTGLPSYGSVVYREPWPGVGLVVSGTAGELKSTFVVRPGANPGAIRLAYRGASAVRLEPDGSLAVDTPLGEIRERAPIAYQEVDGRRVEVAAAFELEPDGEPGRQAYRFRLGEHDPGKELVVDPVTLVYCGYIGGSHYDGGQDIAVDAAGNAYVTGATYSTEVSFPVTVGPDLTHNGSADAFVAKINANGSALGYCGYIGGSDDDSGNGIAVDAAGNAYVTGYSESTEASFPVSVGPDLSYNGNEDAFVAKVDAGGVALTYCGYIGGEFGDYGSDIAVDAAGDAYVTGYTSSTEASFPVTIGPDLSYNDFPPNGPDAFVAKVNVTGTALAYCGYIGGSSADTAVGIAVDDSGNTYVAGETDNTNATFPVTVGPDLTHNGLVDAFVARVDAAGTALDYCGYIGGEFDDRARGIAVDADGNSYVSGSTFSSETSFPVTVGPDLTHNGGDWDAFVAKVNATGSVLAYCGYIGGSDLDGASGIAIDAAGNAYVSGDTRSTEASFPVTVGPDLTHNGNADAFVARVNTAGTALEYCGYIGGQFDDIADSIAVDAAGDVYVTGWTFSTEASFPVTVGPDLSFNGGYHDAFAAKVSGFLFGDSFESGDTTAWSATVP